MKSLRIKPGIATLLCLCAAQSCALFPGLMAQQPESVQFPETLWRTNHIAVQQQDNNLNITTTGIDPYLVWKWNKPLRLSEPVLCFEYFCPDGMENISLFPGPPITSAMQLKLPDLSIAEGWREYAAPLKAPAGKRLPSQLTQIRIDLGQQKDRKISLRNIRLRLPTPSEREHAANLLKIEAEKTRVAKAIREYTETSFTASFTEVAVGTETITLRGEIPQDLNTPISTALVRLVEFPANVQINEAGITLTKLPQWNGKRFFMVVPRMVGNRDRLYSGWRLKAVANQSTAEHFLTARHHVSAFKTNSKHTSTPLRPENQKGLSGFSHRGPRSDLLELGIKAVTVNLVLNRFLSYSSGPNQEPIPAVGPDIYFNHAAFGALDQLVNYCRQHNIIVTAIVLIPRSTQTRTQAVLQHPEAAGGVYAMPDLTTARGAVVYGHLLQRIAKRYSNPNRAPGVITNWIAHNEVDYHPVWTNMGKQPDEIYLETYFRSMRMIHNAARAFNPHARVFISLTHNWNVTKPNRWEQLSPKKTLIALQRYSKQEGDFAWGVAYHPYPQSLFAKTAWHDTNTEDHMDSPLITMQNLHVLGDFLDQKSMRQSNGKRRGVLLSEQGYHTPTYESLDQSRQAGSLHYAMKKIRKYPWVESFHYHRWVDHPDEGGLKLGLRTLPTKQHPNGERKRAWTVYQAINTEEETSATAGLPKP